MYSFNLEHLVGRLKAVPVFSRIAFAASCATRLLPIYNRFCTETRTGDYNRLAKDLDYVWTNATSANLNKAEITEHIDRSMQLIPEDRLSYSVLYPCADDAVKSVVYSLRTLHTGQAQESAWAAQCVYEALDSYVLSRKSIDLNSPSGEREVLQDILIQDELERQHRDLRIIADYNSHFVENTVAQLRLTAEREIAIPY